MPLTIRQRRLSVAASSFFLLQAHHGLIIPAVRAYDLVEDYSGATFFDKWDFYGQFDNLTNGDVIWQDRTNATTERLAFVNEAGNVVIKVDNTTNVPYNIKRDTVRITTQQAFGVGSLFIADFVHLPFGCSVWPAFWTKGINWPSGGEIDIVEGVNLMAQNQMALHTRPGCMNVPPAPGAQTGQTGQLNCSQDAGCTVLETIPNSFGQGFAQAGGGVWATQFDVAGIFIWFWSRANIPPSILNSTSTSPFNSLADWGPPSASYPSSPANCNVSTFFDAQNLVLDITLCGDWAGVPSIYLPQCSSQGPTGLCYNDNVIGSGDRYANAYFEIKYVRVYSTVPVITSSGPSNTTASGSISVSPTGTGGANQGTTTSGGLRRVIIGLHLWIAWLLMGIALY